MNCCIYSASAQDASAWLRKYRAYQILCVSFNSCLSELFIPFNIAGLLVCATFTTYSAIRLDLDPLLTLGLLASDAIFVFNLSIWKKGASLTSMARRIVAEQRGQCGSAYAKRVYKSCSIIPMKIGRYCNISEIFLLSLFGVFVDSTITLLLATM